MNICMLLEGTYPSDIRVRKEAATLVEDGHDVTLLCWAEEDAPAVETVHGMTVKRLPLRDAHSGPRGAVQGLAYMADHVHRPWADALDSVCERQSIDVVHVHDLPLVRTGLAVARPRGLRVVADLHENWPEAVRQYRRTDSWRRFLREPSYLLSTAALPIWRLERLERSCVRQVDRVITVVEEAKDHYVGDCDVYPGKVSVLSNVVSLAQFDTESVVPADVPGEFVVMYVGSLGGKHRGLETVVRAMETVVSAVPEARLVIVGGGSQYERTLRACAREVGVEEQVELTGWVDFEEVPRYIAASDVCLVPHEATPHTETTVPHKLFQYMALGKPVVVTDVPPLKRVVSETESGIVVPAGDVDAMAAAFRRLHDDPTAGERMGEHGRQAVRERYNWETESKTLSTLYEGL